MGRHKQKGKFPQRPPKPPKHMQTIPPANLFRTTGRWGWIALSLVVTLLALYEAWPRLSVDEGVSLDPKNPYSSLFAVANEGYIPATNFNALCEMSFSDNLGDTFENFRTPFPHFAERLGHADRSTLPCFRSVGLQGGAAFTTVGDLKVTVWYSVWPLPNNLLARHQQFHFKAIAGPDGQMHWTYVN